ncbi:MAG: ATP-binding cassette domain-containing protein, partial [Desulfurococcaceae archaeon]
VRAGEVVGIAGIVGNGQRELLEAIVGLRKAHRGKVFIDNVEITNKGIGKARDLGVGFIPDLPLKYGVAADASILENVAALFQRNGFIVRWRAVKGVSKEILNSYQVLAKDERVPVKVLSGGNIMKVLVGRELTFAKKALVAYNPTRGLDEVTSMYVRKLLKEKASKEGTAILFASEDLDEVLQVSDKVLVMNSGEIVGPFDPERASRDEIERAMVM